MDSPLLEFVTFILFGYLSCYNFNQQQKLAIMPILAEISILILICLLIGLSQTAGIGGGPLINTCLMLMYDSKTSISLTYLFIFGGSLASIWKNYRKGKKQGRQLINIDLIMITLPLMNSGAMLGIMVRNYLSELWITVFLTILFLYLIRDITKCIVQRRKKMKEKQASNQIRAQSTTERDLSIQKSSQCLERPNERMSCPYKQQCQQSLQQNSQRLDKNCEGHKSFEQQNKIKQLSFFVLFVLFYGITVLLTVFKGGITHQSIIGLERCSNVGILIVLMFLMFSIVFSLFIASYITKFRKSMADRSTLQQQQLKLYNKLKVTQIPITKNHMKRYLFCGILAGVVGAALGIGGAPILIPLWLSMEIDPIAASSSTAPLILSSSLISITISGLNNNYQQFSFLSLALYTLLSVISSGVIRGTYLVMLDILSYISDKYKLKDFVIILLLAIMILGLVIFLPFQATKMQNYETFNKIGQFC